MLELSYKGEKIKDKDRGEQRVRPRDMAALRTLLVDLWLCYYYSELS